MGVFLLGREAADLVGRAVLCTPLPGWATARTGVTRPTGTWRLRFSPINESAMRLIVL
jgi:hypothetical protein